MMSHQQGEIMAKPAFEIADDKTFDENAKALGQRLAELDGELGPALEKHLQELSTGTIDKTKVWDDLLAAVEEQKA